jgi:hypothetical protein
MTLQNWLRKLLAWTQTSIRPTRKQRLRRTRLYLQKLEDRCLLRASDNGAKLADLIG